MHKKCRDNFNGFTCLCTWFFILCNILISVGLYAYFITYSTISITSPTATFNSPINSFCPLATPWWHLSKTLVTPSLLCAHIHSLSSDWVGRPCLSKYFDSWVKPQSFVLFHSPCVWQVCCRHGRVKFTANESSQRAVRFFILGNRWQ